MNKRGQWNYGVGVAFLILGIYLIIRRTAVNVIGGAVLVGFGVWLIAKDIAR